MDLKQEIQAVLMQAAEIKQLKEQMINEIKIIEKYSKRKQDQLAVDLAKIEIKIALNEINNDCS